MIRESEETVTNMLKEVTLKDDNGKEYEFPIIYANREKLEACAIFRDGDKEKMKLPMLAFHAKTISRNQIVFKGNIWTLCRQDMNKIIEGLFRVEDAYKDKMNGEQKLTFGTFTIEDEPADKQMVVLKANFEFSLDK